MQDAQGYVASVEMQDAQGYVARCTTLSTSSFCLVVWSTRESSCQSLMENWTVLPMPEQNHKRARIGLCICTVRGQEKEC
jgi:hypothetical protein